jgi:hypothetical protein
MTDTINSQRVRDIVGDCLVETPEGETLPINTVFVEGILHTYAFRPDKLIEHHAEVRGMLELLPDAFRVEVGGGWSFLNACDDRNGVQWTGEHWCMEMLFCLGIGMGLAKWLLPKDMWSALPGGMPYVGITLGDMKGE